VASGRPWIREREALEPQLAAALLGEQRGQWIGSRRGSAYTARDDRQTSTPIAVMAVRTAASRLGAVGVGIPVDLEEDGRELLLVLDPFRFGVEAREERHPRTIRAPVVNVVYAVGMATLREPEVVVSSRIERHQRQLLERIAAQEDRTVSALIRRAVNDFLASRPGKEEDER
jgi:hypothetical protein